MTRLLAALLFLAPAAALSTSCGSSDSGTKDATGGNAGDPGGGGSSGSSATGGSSTTGGVSGTAGSSSGRGGTGTSGDAGAPGTGGTGDAGMSGSGGDAGAPTGGVGGDAGGGPGPGGMGGDGPDSCPGVAPDTGDACDAPRTLCQYGQSRCVCGRGVQPTWTCTVTDCPDIRPENMSACSLDDTLVCRYEGAICACRPVLSPTPTREGQWNCARCPAAPPANDARCPTVGAECSYPDDVTCTCTRTGWTCVR
jgi:hypothetical protein